MGQQVHIELFEIKKGMVTAKNSKWFKLSGKISTASFGGIILDVYKNLVN